MEVLIKAGAVVDVPTSAEVTQTIQQAWRDQADAQQRAEARGIKAIRLSAPGSSPAAKTLYIANGPEPGYLWSVRLLSVQLASADTVLAYITSSAPGTGATPQRLIANMSTSSANQVVTFTSASCLLNPAESVYLAAAAQNITAYFLAGWEVPAEMAYKIL